MSSPTHPQVTQVLLTFNSAKWLERTIAQLLATGLPIVAVDNASADDSVAILRRHPEIAVISLPSNIGAAARNHAVQQAKTPYIAFCDDDTWYDLDGLHYSVELFERYPKLAAITARILVNKEERLDPISHIMAQSPLQETEGIPGKVLMSFMGGATVMRRDAYLGAGGYDERFFMGGEEAMLAWKMAHNGWQMRYVPEVICHHYPSLQNYQSMRHFGLRNAIVNAWLHRPAYSAARYSWNRLISEKSVKGSTRKAIFMSLKMVPLIIRERRVLPTELEAKLRALEVFKPAPLSQPAATHARAKARTAH